MEIVRETALMTLQCHAGTPRLVEAARTLGLPTKALDREFGVVSIDPDKGSFVVRVFSEFLPARQGNEHSDTSGPYSDPKISPFGIPRR